MMLHVNLVQKAQIAYARLPDKERTKALRVINYLEMGNEQSLNSTKLPNTNLYLGKVSNDLRVIYEKAGDVFTIIDFVSHRDMQKLANTNRG